jgi:hypothetical protein
LRALFVLEPSELDLAGLLDLNRAVENKIEALQEADAEEVREEVLKALDERRLEITKAFTQLGPFTETAASKKRRTRQRTQEAQENADERQASTG